MLTDSQRSSTSAAPVAVPRTAHFHYALVGTLAGLALAFVLPDAVVAPAAVDAPDVAAALPAAAPATPDPDARPGRLTAHERWITPPDGHVATDVCARIPRGTWFPNAAAAEHAISTAWSDPAARATAPATLRCAADGCTVNVPGASLAALSRSARRRWRELGSAWETNSYARSPLFRRGLRFDAAPGLDPAAREALAALAWDAGDGEALSDPGALCDLNLAGSSRAAAFRAVWSARTTDVFVEAPRPEDIAAVARYWAWGRDPAALQRSLETAWWSGRTRFELDDLLPPLMLRRVGTYPAADDDEHNCLNAVLATRDEVGVPPRTLTEVAEARLTLDFERADASTLRAGDLLVWRRDDGVIMHAAAWLAEGHVFTKNGSSHLSPWIIAPVAAVRWQYGVYGEPEAWRRRAARNG